MPNSMPSFFANPFMTPFMPQQAATVNTTSVFGGGSSGSGGGDGSGSAAISSGAAECSQLSGPENCDYRSNPLQTGNYVSLQCQEMMQHYIQSLMVAASQLSGTNNLSSSSYSTTTTTTITTAATATATTATTTSNGDNQVSFSYF